MRRLPAVLLGATAAVVGGVYVWYHGRGARLAREMRRAPGSWPVQTPAEGYGPLFFRYYRVDIARPKLDARALMQQVQAGPDAFSPGEIAHFEKTHGAEDEMAEGDEFYIHIRSPWDGPVRVADVSETHFRLVTLGGHLETGAIRFLAKERPQGGIRFEIASCARSASGTVHLAYDVMRVARGAQTLMWATFCRRVAEAAGGEILGDVQIHTFRASYDDPLTPGDAQQQTPYQAVLADLAARALNFEPTDDDAPPEGWNHDDDRIDLIPEPPGPPLENGSWQHARAFVQAYRFPDPRRVVGHYDTRAALEGRTMLLQARFMGLAFPFGVRISRTFDETRDTPDGPLRVWGYSYRTLEKHFERGEITFEVVKHIETGRVEFRIHSYSQRAHIPNVLFRAGFRLFGRTLQRQFAATALERTREYVEERLVREACLAGDAEATRLLLRDPLPVKEGASA